MWLHLCSCNWQTELWWWLIACMTLNCSWVCVVPAVCLNELSKMIFYSWWVISFRFSAARGIALLIKLKTQFKWIIHRASCTCQLSPPPQHQLYANFRRFLHLMFGQRYRGRSSVAHEMALEVFAKFSIYFWIEFAVVK